MSPAAEALQLPCQPSLLPGICTDLGASQQKHRGAVEVAGKRLKRNRPTRGSEDRHFIKQFTAEAGALLGIASTSQRQAAHHTLQGRSMFPTVPKTVEGHTLGQGICSPEDPAAEVPVRSNGSGSQAKASIQCSRAAQDEPVSASPKHRTAPAGKPIC